MTVAVKKDVDLLIIGAGSGGYVAAILPLSWENK